MRHPIRRRATRALLATATLLGAVVGGFDMVEPAAAEQVVASFDTADFDPSASGPQSGVMANGISWSVDIGEHTSAAGYGISAGQVQTWTLSPSPRVRIGISGLNCAGEGVRVPGAVLRAPADLHPDHTWDPATQTLSGNPADQSVQTFLEFESPRSSFQVIGVNAAGCLRGVRTLQTSIAHDGWECGPSVWIAQGDPTQLSAVGFQEGGEAQFFPHGPASVLYNAIGYNEADGYIYGFSGNDLVRISAFGLVNNLGPTTPPIEGGGVFAGAFLDGTYYVKNPGSTLYAVDVSTKVATPIALETDPMTADFTAIGDHLWGQVGPALVRINPLDGDIETNAAPFLAGVGAGAAWTFGNGSLGLSNNNDGDIYQVRINDPDGAAPTAELVFVTPGPASSNNDGTSCFGQPVDMAIEKSVDPQLRPAGPGPITWTIRVQNVGGGTSSGYVVKDTIPASVANLSTDTPGCTIAGNVVTCVGGENTGEVHEIVITGTAPGGVTIRNEATVTGNEEDPNPDNNTASAVSQSPVALCKGRSVGLPLGIDLIVANQPQVPCTTANRTLLNLDTQIIGTPLTGLLSILNSTVKVEALNASTTGTATSAAAAADVARVKVAVPLLGLNIEATALHSEATSELVDDEACIVESSSLSRLATLKVNGKTYLVGDGPLTIPLIVGNLYINQDATFGNLVTRRVLHLDLPGELLDVVVGESRAGMLCL